MDNEIILKEVNGEITANSREVAEKFEKRHSDVLEKIVKLEEEIQPTENSARYFQASEYVDLKGETRKEYLLSRDGFSLIVMGFTGKKALEWKLKYIDAFNKMERGKRTEINPVDDASTYKGYYHDPDLGWMPTKEYLDSILQHLTTSDNGFEKEVNTIVSLGVGELQAGCYISNYEDRYICNEYNGGCKSKRECEKIYKKLSER